MSLTRIVWPIGDDPNRQPATAFDPSATTASVAGGLENTLREKDVGDPPQLPPSARSVLPAQRVRRVADAPAGVPHGDAVEDGNDATGSSNAPSSGCRTTLVQRITIAGVHQCNAHSAAPDASNGLLRRLAPTLVRGQATTTFFYFFLPVPPSRGFPPRSSLGDAWRCSASRSAR